MFSWGRSSQKEYWISTGVIIAAMVALAIYLPNDSGINRILTIAWMITWLRRLHDVGKSGWVILGPVILQIAVVLAPMLILGGNFGRALIGDQAILSDESVPYALYVVLVIGIAVLIQIGFSVWLGITAGDPGPNKYGPPPVRQPAVEETFD